jgi:hemerythrin-like domain-containing protein
MATKDSKTSDRRGKGILDRIVSTVSGEDRTEDRTEEAPKATDLLKSQHDDVRKLFKDYENSGENAHATRKRLIDEAGRQLDVHAELEERVFYPACRELTDEDAQKMVGESLEEHLIVKRLIKELRGLQGADEKFESKAAVLKESVEHHADEEEKDLFPAAEREFDDDRLRELGSQMTALKAKLAAPAGRRASPQRNARRRPARA